uniref:NADH-ubiquinone oxidoreductase chain 4 n=1 Tax=Anadara antiquata TaxID=142560 RepID=A0A516IEF0_9BIVA|nr:NADH dehydrogenase subunit 4 [Anadara antiquata]
MGMSALLIINIPWWGYACLMIVGAFLIILNVPASVIELASISMVDVLSWLMVILTLLICSLSILGSKKIFFSGMSGESYLLLMIMVATSLIMAFLSPTIISFYWWFEASLIPMVCLIVGWGYQPERLMAAKYMVLYTLAGSLPFLSLVLVVFFKWTGSWVMWGSFKMDEWWWVLLAPFLVKMPLYGVHSWLPKAHVEAPVAGSMILAGLTLKLGGYGMMRVVSMFKSGFGFFEFLFSIMAIWGTIITPLLCITQSDMKILVAYSSISHMGLVICGILSLSSWGWSGAVMMMIGHAFASSGLFYLVGVIFGWTGTRSMKVCKGVLSIKPHLYFWGFLILCVSMGAPLSINLCGEILLVGACGQLGLMFCVVMVGMSLLTVAYSLYFFGCLFHGSVSECVRLHEDDMLSVFVLGFHVVCAFMGVFLCDFFFF